jgi:hypothetical protein
MYYTYLYVVVGMSEPVLDRVARYFGEGPLLRRVRDIVRRVRGRLREVLGGHYY